ncbi:MAG: hypothetical protein KC643_28320 [Nitrospira sp.]|nr:hypothetical protein [Nitrospira sp.]
MLLSSKQLIDSSIDAMDGVLDTILDVYIDDYFWILCYLVVDTKTWFSGRRVLLTPTVLGQPNWSVEAFPVALTREQIAKSSVMDIEILISREMASELHSSLAWVLYLKDTVFSPGSKAGVLPKDIDLPERIPQNIPEINIDNYPHLRSVMDVIGCEVRALDGLAGYLEDFIINVGNWKIPYLVVDSRDHPAGKRVIVQPQYIHSISLVEQTVYLKLWQHSVKNCPEYRGSPMVYSHQDKLVDPCRRPKCQILH